MIPTIGSIVIRWLGQACFLITTAHGAHLLVDPPNPQVGYKIAPASIAASAVFVSHEHFDHNWTQAAKGSPVIVEPFTSLTPAADQTGSIAAPGDSPNGLHDAGSLGAITYRRIFAYHDNDEGTKRGPDTITVFNVDGLRICHLGDLGELSLTPEQLKSIGPVDVLMIPVGGFFTIDAQEATAIIREIKPRVILPMHYQTAALNSDLRSKLHPVAEFEQAIKDQADVKIINADELSLDKRSLPKRETVYVLNYE